MFDKGISMFDADRPITKSVQDRLGRATFGKYLARCVLDHQIPESLVIGLYGSWGTGKTSIINLMLEELQLASSNLDDNEKPIVLNFSPWSYSGQNQLIYAFFRRLSSTIRQSLFLKNKDRIIQLLELYVSFFTNKPIPQALREKQSWITRMFHSTATPENAYAWESGRDLTQVKAELNDLLLQQKNKIIIVIDNISRIESHEIKQIFQIVKSMGDYNNTVYLLSLDKEHVMQAIGDDSVEYLDKIVQLPFDVPQIAKQDLESILLDRLNHMISLVPEDAWNNEYWADLYYSTLKFFFNNPRDVTRYINTLSFGFSRIKDVVNPVDFFALTAIRVFEPDVYQGIRDNKDLFTDLINNVYLSDKTKLQEDTIRCDEILNRSTKLPAELLQQLIVRMFPRLRNLYQYNFSFFHSESQARKNKNICSPDVFDICFRLSMPMGYIPDSEMDVILASSRDANEFSQALLRLNQDEKIIKFLDALDGAASGKISPQYVGHVIHALLDCGDFFPQGETSLVTFNTATRIHRICHQLLHRVSSSNERFAVYKKAIHDANNSLYSIIHEIMSQESEHTDTEENLQSTELHDFHSDQLLELKKLAVEKISHWAEIGRLIEHPQLIPILCAWKNWEGTGAAFRYIEQATKADRGLVAFLCAALQIPINEAISKLENNPQWDSALKNISDFISPQVIEPHAKELFEDQYFEKLREKEQLGILIFLNLINADTVKFIPKTN